MCRSGSSGGSIDSPALQNVLSYRPRRKVEPSRSDTSLRTSEDLEMPKREMGPALRPTPLSPACGSRGTLDAWRVDAARESGVSVARRSRRCRFRRGLGFDHEDRSRTARRFRDRSFNLSLERCPHCPKALRIPRRQTGKPDLADFAPSRSQRFEIRSCVQSELWGYPGLIPPPRGISPSSRSGSKIPSPSPAFRPLSRKGQSPSRCLDDASPYRFGQRRTGRLIHFRPICQWTRVDNSTARRKIGGVIPGRVAPAAADGGH